MNLSKILSLLLLVSVVTLSSCKKEPLEVLPGTWTTSDGGTITFDSDGTGTVNNSVFFTPLLTQSGETYNNFAWDLVAADAVVDTNVDIEYFNSNGDSAGFAQWPVRVKGKNKVVIGFDALVISNEVELTR